MPATADILPPRYKGAQRIGRGGMGEIYRATDTVLGRAVAVKVLAERYAKDEPVRERFTREALAAARLSGEPNTVTIFDVGEWNDRPFIVMEYLSGGSLEDKIKASGSQEPAQVRAPCSTRRPQGRRRSWYPSPTLPATTRCTTLDTLPRRGPRNCFLIRR